MPFDFDDINSKLNVIKKNLDVTKEKKKKQLK